MIKNKVNTKSEIYVTRAILSSYLILSLQYLIITVFAYQNLNLINIVQTISKTAVAIMYIFAFPFVLRKKSLLIYSIYSLLTVIILFNILIWKNNVEYIKSEIFYLYFVTTITFVYAYCINGYDSFYERITKLSNIILIIGLIASLFIFFSSTGYSSSSIEKKYSMSLSYNLLMPLLIYTNDYIKNSNFISLIKFILSFLIIILLGARGPIMCLGIFLILRFLKLDFKFNKKNIVINLITILIVFILVINYEVIIFSLYRFSKDVIGMESRTLYNMIYVKGLNLTGRDKIYTTMINAIKENPVFGVGFLGDRQYFTPYPHNIFIELIIQFGVFFGGIISLLLILLICYCLKISKGKTYDLLILWVSLGFGPLLVSNTYVEFIGFWVLLGLLFNIMNTNKLGGKNER